MRNALSRAALQLPRVMLQVVALCVMLSACVAASAQSTKLASGFAEVNGTRLYISKGLSQSPEPPTIERLGQIKAPTLVIIGSLDGKNLLNIADMLTTRIPNARKVTVNGASHHPPVETPEEFDRIPLNFLQGKKFLKGRGYIL